MLGAIILSSNFIIVMLRVVTLRVVLLIVMALSALPRLLGPSYKTFDLPSIFYLATKKTLA